MIDPRPAAGGSRPAAPRRRRLGAKLLLAFVAGVGSLELALRVLNVQVPLRRMWCWQAFLGWTQLPRARFDYTLEGRPVHLEFNALGFRDGEHELAKPPGTRRVVVVGDSFCEAAQVNLLETFQQLLRAHLESAGGGPVEAINLGVGDWGQAQELLALRDLGLAYQPDLVVCEVFPLNDLANNAIDLYGLGKSQNDLYRPYFVEQNGTLVETRRHPWLHELRVCSRVFLNVERAWHSLAWEFEGEGEEQKWTARAHRAGFPDLSPLLYTYVDDREQPDTIRRAWRITERLLEEMLMLCRARRVPFVIVVVAWNGVIGDAWAQLQAQHLTPALDADYPERRLLQLGERLGVAVLPTRDLLARSGSAFVSDGHLSPEGHRALAEALFRLIEQRRLLEK